MARKKTTELEQKGMTEGSAASPAKLPRKKAAPKAAPQVEATPDDSQSAIQSSPNYSRIVKHLHKRTEQSPAEAQSATPMATAAIIVNSSATAPAFKSAARPSSEEIAKLAYSYYVARGYGQGDPLADWVRAEQELNRRLQG